MPHGTLALAASIAAMSLAEIRDLLARREIASPRAVRDPLSLAVELLRPDSLEAALQKLNRGELTTLLSVEQTSGGRSPRNTAREGTEGSEAAHVDALRRIGLLGLETRSESLVALPETGLALERLRLRGLEVLPDLRAEPANGASSSGPHDAANAHLSAEPGAVDSWFGPALASTNRAAALLRALAHRPARLSRRGAATVTARKELAEATNDDPAHTAHLLSLLELASLTERWSGHAAAHLLWPSGEALRWLDQCAAERWVALARAHVDALAPELRQVLVDAEVGSDLREFAGPALRREYPLLPEGDHDRIAAWVEAAEMLGLSVRGRLAEPMILLLAGQPEAALDVARRDFPPNASGIYLQPDLSIVVPGPLAPHDEHALAVIADTEHIGAALTMRVSQSSLERAHRSGLATDAIRSRLAELSLTGIPQPLEYLLGDLDRKRRLAEPPAEETAARFVAGGAGRRRAVPESTQEDPAAPDDLSRLAALIHAAAHEHPDAGDLTRQLELAIRERSAVRVTAVGGKEERTFTLLPVSLTAGRLRATDQTAGVERTLPISAITAVDAV